MSCQLRCLDVVLFLFERALLLFSLCSLLSINYSGFCLSNLSGGIVALRVMMLISSACEWFSRFKLFVENSVLDQNIFVNGFLHITQIQREVLKAAAGEIYSFNTTDPINAKLWTEWDVAMKAAASEAAVYIAHGCRPSIFHAFDTCDRFSHFST